MASAADRLKTLVVIPTYNEKDNVRPLCRAVLEQGKGIEVLVVDDNSPDGTAVLAAALATSRPRVHVLCREGKLGLGTAHIAGYRWALERDYERVVTMDADFSHPPERIPAMLEASEDADVVIGSRYCEGGGHEGWPWHRIFLSRASNAVARVCLSLKPKDCTGAFRCFRRSVLERVPLDNIVATGYSFQEEMLWYCSGRGWRMEEVPITFVDRQRGESKISMREIVGGMLTVFRLMFTPERRRWPQGEPG
ncbi:MAG: polyprenol monophosphomannose synthase [Candidatus Brocadiia bacterium]